VDWEGVAAIISTKGILGDSAKDRWETLRRRENDILKGVVIFRKKAGKSIVAPDLNKPKKAPVSCSRKFNESGMAELKIADTQNMEEEMEQQKDGQVGKDSMDIKTEKECSKEQGKEVQAEVLSDDAAEEEVGEDSEGDSDPWV